jgi:uncharacterized protein DUF6252
MKKTLILSTIFIMCLSFYSCEEASDILPIGKMEASIDGTAWKAITRVALLESENFNLTGTSTDGDIISIVILGSTTGTYELEVGMSGVDAKVAGFYKPAAAVSESDNYVITKATVVLSEVNTSDKKISGTFVLEVSKLEGTTSLATIQITNGIFEDMKYTGS